MWHVSHLRIVLTTLRQPYINLKKYCFMIDSLVFLGFDLISTGIRVDDENIKTIQEWPIPKSLQEVRNSHGLTSFYHLFIRNFSCIITTPLSDYMKRSEFKWTPEAQKRFQLVKDKLSNAPGLSLRALIYAYIKGSFLNSFRHTKKYIDYIFSHRKVHLK